MILIEKDNAVEALHQWEQDYTWDEYDAKYSPSVVSPSDVIESQPAIEIVRCGECKHYTNGFCYNYVSCGNKAPDWFCADGERGSEDE